jgi:ADP-ribosylglycohydrolase
MDLTTVQRDRAAGAVLGMAVGDALGAGYEFEPCAAADQVTMRGGGLGDFEPGEWTDDTAMAMPLLDALASGRDLLDTATRDEVAAQWVSWAAHPKDIGINTSRVLNGAEDATAASVTALATALFAGGMQAAGNGSLMRTAPIVLGYLDDPAGLTAAARTYSHMTHGDPVAADACVLWNHAQRHAILHGQFEVSPGMRWIPPERREQWHAWVDAAGRRRPEEFAPSNQWVVGALQEAWAAILSTTVTGPRHFEQTLRRIVAAGVDTDTAAAICGGLLGARWGVSAIPLQWQRDLHGWPGSRTGQDLVELASAAISGTPWPDSFYGPPPAALTGPVQLPHDPGVWIGDVFGLQQLPDGVDAVVSLCRLGHSEAPADPVPSGQHLRVWLVDSPEPEDNSDLSFVAQQAVDAVRVFRAEGHTVYLHCVHAQSRTPFIASLYAAQVTGRPTREVLDEVLSVLPGSRPNRAFLQMLAAN